MQYILCETAFGVTTHRLRKAGVEGKMESVLNTGNYEIKPTKFGKHWGRSTVTIQPRSNVLHESE